MDEVRLTEVHRRHDAPTVEDPAGRAREETARLLSETALEPGARVAITAGSRGIRGIAGIYRAVAGAVREAGYDPFLFSSMGSHGRGTADGQREVLESLGVTERFVGVPVICSERVRLVGETKGPLPGLPVYVAEEAAAADAILAVNRVKPHTSFHGPQESGLMKMLAVGAGRAEGASMVHRLGWENMVDAIRSIGSVILERLPVVGGIALVQNGREELAVVRGVTAEKMPDEEAGLLELARGYLPRLPADDLDVLIVREMGKDYSGTGMDTNVIGRLRLEGIPEPDLPRIRYLGALDLSGASHGNATGVGLADFTTRRLAEKIDPEATYLNCLTSGGPIRAAIPMTLEDDRALLNAVWQALKPLRDSEVRMMVIENTLHLERLWVSEPLVDEVSSLEGAELSGDPETLEFDKSGRLKL